MLSHRRECNYYLSHIIALILSLMIVVHGDSQFNYLHNDTGWKHPFIFFYSGLSGCGLSAQSFGKIIGGSQIKKGEFPWLCSIHSDEKLKYSIFTLAIKVFLIPDD